MLIFLNLYGDDQSFCYYQFKMMLSQFYNRRTSLEPPRKEEPTRQEEDIINSFYEERKSRSSQNVKQHNLLRKNISYFQKEQEDSPPKPLPPPSNFLNKTMPKLTQSPAPIANTPIHAHLSKPPIPKPVPTDIPKSSKPTSQGVPPLPLKQLSHNPSQVSSNFSSLHLSKTGSQQQDFKVHLKNQLNRRINIKHYLSEISEDNKENPSKANPTPSAHQKPSQFRLKYNYDSSVPQRLPSENISEDFSRISFQNSAEERPMQQSRQSSISSLLQQDPSQNNFEFSRNSLTDRIQQNNQRQHSSSNYRHSVPTLGDSRNHSDDGSKKTEKDSAGRNRESANQNVLAGDQLSQLQQNSHPIREEGTESQPTTYKHVLNYFEPEVHAEYKRKIGDLERELQSLRLQRKREDKFIHSIQKMRVLMDGAQQQCSLKELWRWIKALPQRK